MGFIERYKGYAYRVERINGKRVRQKLSEHEAWAMEYQKDYDPNWRSNTPLEIEPGTGWALNPSLPCIRVEGAICRIRTIPGAPFGCLFDGDCPFRIKRGNQ